MTAAFCTLQSLIFASVAALIAKRGTDDFDPQNTVGLIASSCGALGIGALLLWLAQVSA